MTKIRVGGVPEHFNLPWHLCIESGDFEKQNLPVTWTNFHGGTGEMSEALKNGDVDIAIMLTEGSIKEICDGSSFKILQTYVKTPLLWGIHVHVNSSFHKIEDLKNQTAAISRYGSGSHLMTYVHANHQNWNTEDLKFHTAKNLSGAVESLTEGTSDYFLWEHFTTKPLVDKGIFRRLGDQPTPWPCFVVVATEDFLQKQSKAMTTILNVLNQKSHQIKDIKGIESLISERYQLKSEDVKEWLKITEWSQQQISKDDVINVQNQLKNLNLISDIQQYDKITSKIDATF